MKLFLTKYYSGILLFVLIVLSVGIRQYHINAPLADWHSWRQSDTASVSRIFADEGINVLYPRYYDISTIQTGLFNPNGYRFVEFPLYNVLHAYLIRLFPNYTIEYLGRTLTIAISIISAFCVYSLGKRFMGKAGGLLSAFFFLFIPFNVYFSRVILPDPFMVSLALLSMVVFFKYIDTSNVWQLCIGSAIFSVALLVKPFSIFYSLPIIYYLICKEGINKIYKMPRYYVSLFIVLVPFVLWRLWISQYPEGIPFFWWMFNGNDIRFKPSFWKWIFAERIGNIILGGWGVIILAFGILRKKGSAIFPLLFFMSMLLYLTIFAQVNVQHDYYQVVIIPALCLLMAQGVISLWSQSEWNRFVARALLSFCLFMIFVAPMSAVKGMFAVNHPEIIAAGQAVDLLLPKDARIIAPYNGDTAFLYQTKRFGWPFIDRPLNELIDNGADYFVSVDLGHPQTRDVMKRYEIIAQTESYVIANLHKPLSP
jgi:4-amino-4-deoxy-L-arabinose transferase-like glycosyltransferase